MRARICVVGSFNADLTANVASFPRPGEGGTASRRPETGGGRARTRAAAGARGGGAAPMPAARGGDPAGERAIALGRAEGIDADAAPRRTEVPTGSAFILVDGK